MAEGPVHIWHEWAIQILILFSFALQIFLFVFARTRRHGPSAVLMILLWLVYLMADATAVYTLGHLSISDSPREQKITVFWAPFLLVHLGSQDTITAYALEDNQLWPRHLLNLGVQASGVAYILYKRIVEIPTLLGLAAVLMTIVGVIKYGERILALKCATKESMRSSFRKPQYLPTYYGVLPSQGANAQQRDDEELLLFAHAMLPLCKGGIINVPRTLISFSALTKLRWNWNWNWKATFKVVEMEISLMYDILYTKAAVIHTWYGYCIRVCSPIATAVAFILFQLSSNKNGYNKTDVAITYILLVGAFLLDLVSVLSTLGSTWTCNLLWTRGWIKLGDVILSLRRHVKAAGASRGWSGSIGQFNLLKFGCRNKLKLSNGLAKMIGLEDWYNTWQYSETLVISEDVKELVFKLVWKLVREIQHPRGDGIHGEMDMEEPMAMMPSRARYFFESYYKTAWRRKKLADALNFGSELEEAILTWHIFTNFFLDRRDTSKDAASSSTYVKAIKALSDYMVFLVAICPDMIPGLEVRSLYESTCQAVQTCSYAAGVEALARNLQKEDISWLDDADYYLEGGYKHYRVMPDLIKSSIVLSHGSLYARLMLQLADAGNPEKPAIISSYQNRDHVAMDKLKHLLPDLESSCSGGGDFDMPKVLALIFDTWVRLLISASVRFSREAHARLISRGSELTTIVWLMEEHASVFFNQSPRFTGPAAA
ncbi:unnamed protein product [Alopecurus aequalis]